MSLIAWLRSAYSVGSRAALVSSDKFPRFPRRAVEHQLQETLESWRKGRELVELGPVSRGFGLDFHQCPRTLSARPIVCKSYADGRHTYAAELEAQPQLPRADLPDRVTLTLNLVFTYSQRTITSVLPSDAPFLFLF